VASLNGAPASGTRLKRRRWQRRLFGALGVVWLVIALVVGLALGRWTVAGLWFGLAAMELALWFMAGRR
jgi:peptidoglycan/LPS O-acetylase OafA/YrhL